MKRLPLALSTLAALATFATVTVNASEQPGRRHGGPPIERLATELGLDDTQKAEVQRIFAEHRTRMEEERKRQHEELRQQLATILSAEQLQQFDQRMQRQHRRGPRADRMPRAEKPAARQ